MEWRFTLPEINRVAKEFWEATKDHLVIAFHGQMGAGKTTFVHALCVIKGVKDVAGSPTFSIINEYEYDCEGTGKILFHMDLYRLNNEEEAQRAGVEDCLYSGYHCLVEWPEKALGIFPPGTLHVYLELIDNTTRLLKISSISI
jgi:tRNA threonylcarbamoyladenosine biosynthesis protein TsaE